jgi:4-amino-4-deoxy-L-arabinose transferase-like glycosyltransferase
MNGSGMAFEEPALRRAHGKPSQIPAYLLVTLIALWAGCIVILASVPPVDRDALTHHLAVPKLYLKHGGMVEIPSVPFSYYPMNLDLLYLIPLYFGNDIVPKFIHFAFALLTAWLIYGYLRQRLGKPFWGLLGAFMFLSLPVIVKLSVTVYVDLGLIFFSTGSLLYVLKWAENGYPARHLILSGVFCGLALGTKYNALISLLLLASLVPILYVRGEKALSHNRSLHGQVQPHPGGTGSAQALKAVSLAVIFVAVALLVYSPWMIRNILWTGNPLYPLYQGVFSSIQQQRPSVTGDVSASGEADDPSAEEGINHFVARRLAFDESLLETLTIPVRIFFQGQDDNPRLFDGRLNPYLIIFPFFAFLLGGKIKRPFERIERTVLLGFSVLYILFAFFQTDMRIRLVGPAIPPLAILSTLGIHHLIRAITNSAQQKGRAVFAFGVIGAVLVWFLGQNLSYVVDQVRVTDPVSYLAGTLSRDQYIQKYRVEYAAMRYINRHLPPDARVLGVFLGNRRYYCDRDLIFDGTLEAGIKSAASAEALAIRLREKGFTHVIIRYGLFDTFILSRLPADRRNLWQTFINNYTKSLFSEDGHILFELKG